MGDWVYECLPDAVRTQNPMYSFVVIGGGSSEVESCISETTFGKKSPFMLFEKKNGKICLLGAGWEDCTQFHRYEELAQVPYRYYKTFTGIKSLHEDISQVQIKMFVRDLNLAAENDFSPLVRALNRGKSIESEFLERGTVQSCDIQDIKKIALEQLAENKLVYCKNHRHLAYKISQTASRERQSISRVALVGSSNLDLEVNQLETKVNSVLPIRNSKVHCVPFGQLAQEILTEGSRLETFDAELTFFVDRIEDLLGVINVEHRDQESI